MKNKIEANKLENIWFLNEENIGKLFEIKKEHINKMKYFFKKIKGKRMSKYCIDIPACPCLIYLGTEYCYVTHSSDELGCNIWLKFLYKEDVVYTVYKNMFALNLIDEDINE